MSWLKYQVLIATFQCFAAMLDGPSVSSSFIVNFAAGGLSGGVSKTIIAPIEKVKLAIQNQDVNPKVLSGETKRFTGFTDCLQRHYRELGIRSLWRGNMVNCIRYVPLTACNMAFKDSFKKVFRKGDKKTESFKLAFVNFSSGALAGAASNALVYPLLYVRTVMGADIAVVRQFAGMGDCLVRTVNTSGYSSLYNGIVASTIGVVLYRGTQFGLQDTLKAYNRRQKDFTVTGILSKYVVAQISVSISSMVAYPFDTVMRRLQIEATKTADQKLYSGFADCVWKIHAHEGAHGFYKGAFANILRGLGAALVLVFYDEITNAINAS